MWKKLTLLSMAFPVAGGIAPKPCLLLSTQKAFHVRLDKNPLEGPSGPLGPCEGWGVPQLEETNLLVLLCTSWLS